MRILSLILFLLFASSVLAQTDVPASYFVNGLDGKFEKLDTQWLIRNGKRKWVRDDRFSYTYILKEKGAITVISGDSLNGFSLKKYFKNNYFCIRKNYYINGNIKEKGWMFNANWNTEKGIWYEFNKKGNLIKTTDYDRLTRFGFNDVIKLSKKKKAPLKKGYITDPYTEKTVSVSRYFNDDLGHYYWVVSWMKKKNVSIEIKIDGNTGKILEEKKEVLIFNY